jgi:ComF family protein
MDRIVSILQNVVNYARDCMFPLFARDTLFLTYTPETFPIQPTSKFRTGVRYILLSSYRHPAVKSAIHALKELHHPHAAQLYYPSLAERIDALKRAHPDTLIIPIPATKRRIRKMGYHPIHFLFEVNKSGHLLTDALCLTRETRPQKKLTKWQRQQNMHHAFSVNSRLDGTHIILIDDVYTTGATLHEAVRAVREAGADHVTCIALAR